MKTDQYIEVLLHNLKVEHMIGLEKNVLCSEF